MYLPQNVEYDVPGVNIVNEVISVKKCKDKGYVLIINAEMALDLGLDKKYIGCLSFGTQKCYVDIRISEEAEENEVYISQKVMDYLYLPDYTDFEVRANGGEIMIGPHVGMFICNKDDELTKERLKNMLKYVPDYSKFHGSILIFALDKVDRSKRLIEGYCYNPKLNDWQRGIFPYPLSIYLWIPLDRNWKNHFLSAIGDTMFNNYYLNKYEMYNWLSTDPNLGRHLPHTVLYKSGRDVFDMLKLYGKTFVKPIAGFQGIGIVKISSQNGSISVRYRQNKSNMEKHVYNSNEAEELMGELFTPEKYIVQQPIDLLTYEDKVIDFRLVIHKDVYGMFVCKAIIGRIGAAGSIVSNVSSGGKAMQAVDLFKYVLNFSDAEAIALTEEMTSFGLAVCKALIDRGINYGNLGLDIGVDKNRHPWLIEINSRRPDPTIAMDVKDKKLYNELLSGQLFYAKFLAKFGLNR